MAARPRLTVRLAPSYLHALAYIAERDGLTPAEVAREMLAAMVSKKLESAGWTRDWESCYTAWKAEQGRRQGRAESPEQADYDALAAGAGFPAHPAVGALLRERERTSRPVGATSAADAAPSARGSAARSAAKVSS